MGQELVCKITDFGMARDVYKDEIYTKTSKVKMIKLTFTKLPHEHVPKSHVITCDFGTCSCGIFVRECTCTFCFKNKNLGKSF